MIFRVFQIACCLGGSICVVLMAATTYLFATVWTDFGFGNCQGCAEARTSYALAASSTFLTLFFPAVGCVLGIIWAGRARQKTLISTQN
jgi:hypothetical protein